ncbi:LysM peptidoglycan-binding domain-containing protein [Weissella confusa]|uniref:LysM peptidoglycan-binding domain-containing protein n=1 Tax=Weissella confusa TaxID=1583 RepID=UPI00223C071C|nr:LysM domain-containing protein [Weissella confusa]
MSTIASATELTTEEIASANNISDANFIVIGQEINLTKEVAEEVVSEAPVAQEAAVEVAPVVAEVAAPVATQEVAVSEAPVAQEVQQPAAPSYSADYTAVPGNPTHTTLVNARGTLRTNCHGLVTSGVTPQNGLTTQLTLAVL